MARIVGAPPEMDIRAAESWVLDARSISGGPSLSGREQVVFNPFPVWRAKITPNVLESRQQHWAAFIARVRGRGGFIRLNALNRFDRAALYPRFGLPSPPGAYSGTLWGGGQPWSNGMGWAWPSIWMRTAADAAALASTVMIDRMGHAAQIRTGDRISIGGSLHIVVTVTDGGAQTEVGIEPPLRLSKPAGAPISFMPTVVMQMIDDMQGRFERKARTATVDASLDLIEIPDEA